MEYVQSASEYATNAVENMTSASEYDYNGATKAAHLEPYQSVVRFYKCFERIYAYLHGS